MMKFSYSPIYQVKYLFRIYNNFFIGMEPEVESKIDIRSTESCEIEASSLLLEEALRSFQEKKELQ